MGDAIESAGVGRPLRRKAMSELAQLLGRIIDCSACPLMAENNDAGVRYVPILPKPDANIVFIGRDPSPRTAEIVGVKEGNSVFIKEIFKLTIEAGVEEHRFYITDLCKCHWRTSSGRNPLPGTEGRPAKLDPSIAKTCLNEWLAREIEILAPSLLIGFGEELYDIFKDFIVLPDPPMAAFSARADKSEPDAELWFAENGPMTIRLRDSTFRFAIVRHPGNSTRLGASSEGDQRRIAFDRSRARLINELSRAAAA